MKKVNRKIIVVAILVFVAVIITASVIGVMLFKGRKNNDYLKVLVEANMASRGYVIADGDDTYYSDGNTGIYFIDGYGNSFLCYPGKYTDLGLLDGKIYCVEISPTYEYSLVRINIESKEKRELYAPPRAGSLITGVNVLDGRYYFSVDNDVLYYADKSGSVESTGIRNVIRITERGVYITELGDYGLRLISFDGKTLQTYPELNEYEVYHCFEMKNTAYLQCKKAGRQEIYRLNLKTGKISLFPDVETFFDDNIVSYLNYSDGTFYLSTSRRIDDLTVELKVFSIDNNGKNIEVIHSKVSSFGLPFCTVSIANGYLIINYPGTTMQPLIFNINDLKNPGK